MTNEVSYPWHIQRNVTLVDKLVPDRITKIKNHICVDCNTKVEGFDDELSQNRVPDLWAVSKLPGFGLRGEGMNGFPIEGKRGSKPLLFEVQA